MTLIPSLSSTLLHLEVLQSSFIGYVVASFIVPSPTTAPNKSTAFNDLSFYCISGLMISVYKASPFWFEVLNFSELFVVVIFIPSISRIPPFMDLRKLAPISISIPLLSLHIHKAYMRVVPKAAQYRMNINKLNFNIKKSILDHNTDTLMSIDVIFCGSSAIASRAEYAPGYAVRHYCHINFSLSPRRFSTKANFALLSDHV
ncbi:hypothetical protein Tco_0497419 [Tanacetum coccineum]